MPWYFFLVVLYFCYDDIPAPDENALLYKLAAFVIVMVAIPFAFGQGHIVMQMLNSIG